MRKLISLLLCLLMCLSVPAQAVLPDLPGSLPWYGAWSGMAPDVRSTDDDGNILMTYHDVSAAGYEGYSDFLEEAGYTLVDHLYHGSSLIALLSDGVTDIRVAYDLAACELTVTFPQSAFLRAWAEPADIRDFYGMWMLHTVMEDGALEDVSADEEQAFLIGEDYCYSYLTWDEATMSFDGRLLTIEVPYYTYILFFDASGTLQVVMPDKDYAATLKPIIAPSLFLGMWDMTGLTSGDKTWPADEVTGGENWSLLCTEEGVYEVVNGEIYSSLFPWRSAQGTTASFRYDGPTYYLTMDEQLRVHLVYSSGESINFAPHCDLTAFQGAWTITDYIDHDGTVHPDDSYGGETVWYFGADGLTNWWYDSAGQAHNFTIAPGRTEVENSILLLGAWENACSLVERYTYNLDGEEHTYLTYTTFTIGEDGRMTIRHNYDFYAYILTRTGDEPILPELPAEDLPVEELPAEDGVPAEETPAEEDAASDAVTLTASAKGLLSDVTVTVTLNEDGTIASMSVDASGETEAIAAPCTEEAFLSNFIGKAGPFEDVDVVAGATYTSNAVINAVNSLFPADAEP